MGKKQISQDILNLTWEQLGKMNRRELAKTTSILVSSANKRIRRLEKSEYGKYSPAYKNISSKGRLFSVKGKDLNQLRNEYANVSEFLKMKTSSLSGWREVRKRIEREIGVMDSKQSKRFWEAYRRLQETNNIVDKSHRSNLTSDRIQRMLYKSFSQQSKYTTNTNIIKQMEDRIEKVYEKGNINPYFNIDEFLDDENLDELDDFLEDDE